MQTLKNRIHFLPVEIIAAAGQIRAQDMLAEQRGGGVVADIETVSPVGARNDQITDGIIFPWDHNGHGF